VIKNYTILHFHFVSFEPDKDPGFPDLRLIFSNRAPKDMGDVR